MNDLGRRDVLIRGSAWSVLVFTGLVTSREALAIDEEFAFNAPSMHEALRALGGIPAVGSQIVLTAPDVAENGAMVSVAVDCSLPGVREIFIVVEANPNPLCVRFTIPEGTDPFVSTRIKMAESSKIYAVVRAAEGKLYATSKATAVTVGGCG